MTSKVHDGAAPAVEVRKPSVRDSPWRSVPRLIDEIVEPAPQGSVGRVPTDTGNGRKVVSSSMKATSEASAMALVLATVKRMTTSSPPPTTGSSSRVAASRKVLVRVGTGSTKSRSVAGSPNTVSPPMSALIALVVLR